MNKKRVIFVCFSEFDENSRLKLEAIFEDIFTGKVEFKSWLEYKKGIPEDPNDNCIYIRNISESRKIKNEQKDYSLIYFYEKNLNTNAIVCIGNTLPIPLGLFCLDKFNGTHKEYSEIARFEKVIKDELRRIIDREVKEESITKTINWKVEMNPSFLESSNSHVSLLSDPSMREVMLHSDRIINKITPESELMLYISRKKKKAIEQLREACEKKESSDFVQTLKTSFSNVTNGEEEDSKKFRSVRRIPTILIEGSTGTGKSLMAKYIARKLLSQGKAEEDNKGFLSAHYSKVSMANLGKETMDTELFGCIPGDFTGSTLKMGKLLSNYGGILFLDEIGEAPLQVQTKLLTYIDDMSIQMPGYSDPEAIRVPMILIAATNRELKKEIEHGLFREDLYHRFVYKIKLPDLKDRRDDFRFLLSFALQKMNVIEKSTVKKISIKAIEYLERHDFPGNFRELEARCSKAIANAEIAGRDVILKEDFEMY